MKMDLKHFKKLHSNDKSTTFVHKNGHKIVVAHSGVDESMRKQLSELPKFESGGTVGLHADYSQEQKRTQVQESYTGKSSEIAPKERKQLEKSVSQKLGNRAVDLRLPTGMAAGGTVRHYDEGTDSVEEPGMSLPENTSMGNVGMNQAVQPDYSQMMSPMSPEQANPEQLQNVQIPQPAPQQNPMAQSMATQASDTAKSMAMEEHGINAQAQAESNLGQREVQVAKQQQQESHNLQQSFQVKSQAIDNERMQVYNDLKNGHIEPNHFVQSMGGFQKGMTAIGLILSGMGSGLAGQSNMAMDFLNKQIDRDIDGQKAEMGKKENLLSHLNQQFGNLRDATTMAKALQSDMYAAKMLEVAAQSKDPMAKARAEQAVAQLHFQRDPEVNQMKMRQAAFSSAQNGMPSEQLIPLLVPKEQQGKALDSIGKLKDLNQNAKVMDKLFEQAARENTIARTGAGLARTPASVTNLQNMFLPIVKDLEGRINEYEFESVKKFIPAPGDAESKIQAKLQGMHNFIAQKNNEHASVLRAFGVPIPQRSQGFNKR